MSNPPITHVLVRTMFDERTKRYYWRREIWFNDPVIGAQPPDKVVDGAARFKSQVIAMRIGLRAAAEAIG